jgi:hypothetical protein
MATVTCHIEVEVTMKCSKKAAKFYAEEGSDDELQPILDRLEEAIESAIIKTKGYESHDFSATEIEDAEAES